MNIAAILLVASLGLAAIATATTTGQAYAQQSKPNHIQWAFFVDILDFDGVTVVTHQIHTETKKDCEEFRETTAQQPRVISVGECFKINLKKL